MDWLVVTGPDRVSWLQGMVSNDVGSLRPGQGCAAAHLSPQGKVLALIDVLAEEDRLCLLSEHQPDSALYNLLDRLLIMEDATLEDQSAQFVAFSLLGIGGSDVLGTAFGFHLDTLFDHASSEGVRAVRTPIGHDLLVPARMDEAFRERMEDAGAVRGDEELRRLVWIERGIPRWGVDVDPTVTLPELGEDAIDYQKGCYIGQEVVAKIKYLGHVNRRLRGLRIDGTDVPGPGLLRRDGREAGRLTSAVASPAVGGIIGLGYLRRGFDAPGTEVVVLRDGGEQRAVVVALPFVNPAA